MPRYSIITVTAAVASEDLHADDASVAGTYGVAMGTDVGLHSPEPRAPLGDDEIESADDQLAEAAKDVFHDKIGIHDLDDFDIDVRVLPDGSGQPDEDDGRTIDWL